MAGDSFPTQLISDNGELDAASLQLFSDSVKLHQCGISYAVVGIMGPQSSGKSTLLNYLFGTNFGVMDERLGRNQTTQGIWIGKAEQIEPLTVVMDLEGADSKERANENNATFEKQIATFAVAVANILVINIWYNDIGRETASNRPLLKAVFQGMMRMFEPRKTTLLYIIRDMIDKVPLEILDNSLRQDIEKIWNELPNKPPKFDIPLSECFSVEVTALPSYIHEEENFKRQVAQRRQLFMHSTSPGGLACNRRSVVPASAFCSNIKNIWDAIKQNKDLDLPAFGILVANTRCEEIASEKLNRLACDKDWVALEQAVDAGAIIEFRRSATTSLNKYLSEYDAESNFFDEAVRNGKRQILMSKSLKEVVYPCYKKLLRHFSSVSFESFKIKLEEKLDGGELGFAVAVRECHVSCIDDFLRRCSDATVEGAKWDASKARGELEHDMEAHVSVIRSRKLSELVDANQKKLREAVGSLFETGGSDTWASIRDLLQRESDIDGSELSCAVAGFKLERQTVGEMMRDLKEYATNMVLETSKQRADNALNHMKERFFTVISQNVQNQPMRKRDIKSILKYAQHQCLELLAVMAVIRLEEGMVDSVEDLRFSSLITQKSSSRNHPLDSNTWAKVPPQKTLIKPIECKLLWKRYNEDMKERIKTVQKRERFLRVNGNGGEYLNTIKVRSSSPTRSVPTLSPPSAAVGVGANGGVRNIIHTVSKYDTLAGVAIKYGVEV